MKGVFGACAPTDECGWLPGVKPRPLKVGGPPSLSPPSIACLVLCGLTPYPLSHQTEGMLGVPTCLPDSHLSAGLRISTHQAIYLPCPGHCSHCSILASIPSSHGQDPLLLLWTWLLHLALPSKIPPEGPCSPTWPALTSALRRGTGDGKP